MKIATYNIWNSDKGMPIRKQQIIQEIQTVNADIMCLQEVREEIYRKIITEIDNYEFHYFHTSNNENDALAILSKFPLLIKKHINGAIISICEVHNKKYLVVNIHFPWDSSIQKEQFIVNILKEIQKIKVDNAILTGDFNCSENSSVHHYLTGERTLLNSEANPYWEDLAEVYADITNTKTEKTLNIRTNPRWQGKPYAYTSARLDRIYLRDTFPKPPPLLRAFSLFGKTIDEKTGNCASDHYGVYAELDFN